ncbi:hypothetical protein SVIO_049860 [Streptomyces violaceusniger]|uniref:Uncharacterized protein n=1 Tax=Streptomyces violaceusniger TaxID=68280 RepID=A0A4D4L8I1_STRVO|nr:hypothetical protein SVIO_049860 [Streptomyces violaceusniger]
MPVAASTVQWPAVSTTDLLSLLATVAEQAKVPPEAFWKKTLPAVVLIRPPPVQAVGDVARGEVAETGRRGPGAGHGHPLPRGGRGRRELRGAGGGQGGDVLGGAQPFRRPEADGGTLLLGGDGGSLRGGSLSRVGRGGGVGGGSGGPAEGGEGEGAE